MPSAQDLATSAAAMGAPSMVVYTPDTTIDQSTLAPLGAPESLGGRVLEGSPSLSARVDYSARGMTAGIFKATTGRIEITFPFTEHATILAGEVTMTDESGQSRTFKKGDSYFIRQGQVVLWDVRTPYVLKSFFNITEPLQP
ncbi:cupin domain-containing protein [Cystobacter fuscus]|nr:cupin domain-containing protein [Cystobacter fuscus]